MLDADAITLVAELELLRAYAATRGLELLTPDDFVDLVFFRYAHELGGLCVGFNLPLRGRGANRNVKCPRWSLTPPAVARRERPVRRR